MKQALYPIFLCKIFWWSLKYILITSLKSFRKHHRIIFYQICWFWHNYMVSKCNFWWFFLQKVGHYELSILRHIYKYSDTFFWSKKGSPFFWVTYEVCIYSRFCYKTTTILTENSLNNFVKKNLRCKYNILYLLQTSIIFINIVE